MGSIKLNGGKSGGNKTPESSWVRKTSEKVGNRSLGWIVLWEKHSESSTVTLSPIKFNKKHKKVWNKLLNIAEHHYSLWEVPIYSTKSYVTVWSYSNIIVHWKIIKYQKYSPRAVACLSMCFTIFHIESWESRGFVNFRNC